jgi:hypothetical protein
MHLECEDFIHRMYMGHMDAFTTAKSLLEGGSMDVNGTAKAFFPAVERFVGVDWRAGQNVTHVGLVHEYKAKHRFQFVLSTEMLEHDPYWEKSLRRMVDLVDHGGSLLVTCAGPGRKRHRDETSPDRSYRCLTTSQLLSPVLESRWAVVIAEDDLAPADSRIFCYRRLT